MNYKPTNQEWLSVALADEDDPRFYLSYIYSDGERLIATNGHVLHVVNQAMDKGYYYDSLIPTDVDHKYPDIDKVIPKACGLETPFSSLPDPFYKKFNFTIERIYEYQGLSVNANYLERACIGFDNPVIQFNGPTDPLKIVDDNRLAVIMPMRVES